MEDVTIAESGGRDWWDDLLPIRPHEKPPGPEEMLHLLAYDITDDRRLRRIAKVCEDYGVRVQKSLFECWLDADRFEELWGKLLSEMDPKEDFLVAYPVDAGSTRKRRTAGRKMVVTEKRTRYVF